MKPSSPRSRDNAVLAAVLAAGEPGAAGWETSLPPEDHAEARAWATLAGELAGALRMESDGLRDAQRAVILDESRVQSAAGGWSVLADELADALRMGPGGLTDTQRAAILEAASQPARLGTQSRARSRPWIGRWWKWSAAAGIAATLAVLAILHGQRDNDLAAGTPLVPTPPVARDYRLRILPGDAFGSRYLSGGAARRMAATREQDRSAIGSGGGFQPVALANMAELIPMPAPYPDIALADLVRAENTPGGPWVAALINSFAYDYPQPPAGELLSVSIEAGPCPWQPANRLVHIGLRASAGPGLVPDRHGIVASDVRMVVDFNPGRVAAYRLLGHGPVASSKQKDQVAEAGADLRAGQLVTVIYEIVPASIAAAGAEQDSQGADILAARVLYRQPGETTDRDRLVVLGDSQYPDATPSNDFQFAAAVAAFGLLRDQAPGLQRYGIRDALALARANLGADPDGKRGEFVRVLAGEAR